MIDDAELTLSQYIDVKNLKKIHKFKEVKEDISREIIIFKQEVSQLKQCLYFCRLFSQQESSQSLLKNHFDGVLKHLESELKVDLVSRHHLAQYKEELEKPYSDMNKEIDNIKQSY
jgi:endonuclease IV